MAYPVPEVWTVSGTLNKNGVPFFEGKVYADNLNNNGQFEQIAESGISADGSFTLTYSRGNFQNGDESLEFPTIRIRVEDYQGNNLWTSNTYREPSSALKVGAIDILKSPDQNGDCRIFGTVKNEQGDILANIKIIAYCLHFVDTSVDGEAPSGYFEKIILGETLSGSDGKYERRYSSSLLPVGLLLDSKEDYGKNKVSLYAEAYEKKGGIYYHKSTEHLVFNGKTEQEINFTLKSQQESFECEYAKLDSMLRVYRNTVDSWCTAPVNNTKKINAINAFLNSNTVFPLVAGRERIVDSKVHAYFTAYSMFLQLQKRELEGYSNFTAKEENCWLEIFFALALREDVSTLYKLTKAKPTIIQKTLFGAVSDGLICPTDTTLVLDLWKTLVNGGTLRGDEDDDKNDALTISQLLSLYIKEDLTIEYPSTESESSTGDDSENEEKAKELPHYVAVENFDSEDSTSEGEDPDNDGEGNNNENPLEEDNQQETQEPESAQNLYDKLLDAYYSVGADVDAFIELLQENALVENNEQAEGDANSELDAGENEADSNDEELDIQIESDENILLPQEIVVPQLTQEEISRLKAVFDLNEFFEKFAPGIVCTYRYVTRKENFDFCKLSDLLRLADTDWENIVNAIAEEYYVLYCYESEEDDDDDNADDEQTEQEPNSGETPQNNDEPENTPVETTETIPPCALPAEFPGNNVELKKVIYARKLSEQVIAWFPQQALLWDLKKRFVDSNWEKVCEELMTAKWEKFSLSDTDLGEYVGGDDSFFDIAGVELEPDPEPVTLEEDELDEPTGDQGNNDDQNPEEPNAGEDSSELSEDEIRDKVRKQNKEKILQLQRLYHLTESAKAIAYLINRDFKSAYQISTMSESEFIARHGSGIGKVAEARNIHRLAQNYMAEASLNIQAYVTSTVEESVDEDFSDEDNESLVPQNEQNGQEVQNETLRALPRALPKAKMLKASRSTVSTNTAKIREATRDTINWAGLFGNVNFTKATQGQSILSASAYYIDLLKFLKKSSAYSIFVGRRPDYLDLQLTKANAEIPMPTIDLGIELLECLVDEDLDRGRKARLVANNNPDGVTAAELRAEPLEFKTKIGSSIDTAACNLLATKIYPFQLPANFSRDKAKKILSNLSLHFYDIAEALELNGNDANACRELRLDFNQRCLVDLLSTDSEKQSALSQFNSQYNTWDLWGLKELANKVLYPDKNYTSAGTYIGILRRVAIFMQRTGFTIQDLNEILANENFSDVCYRSKDSELYQLSNINGYEFAGKKVFDNETGKEVEMPVDWESFFRKMAVLVHRKNILGWSLSDVLLTFNLPLEKLDVICELIGRYGISVQDALVLGGEQEASANFINSIYQLPNLLVSVNKKQDGYRRTVLKLLTQGLKLSEDESISVYGMIDVDENASLLEGLFECYRYTLIAKTFGVSLPNLDKIIKYGVWTNSDWHSLEGIRKFSDEWRILSGTSIDAEFYLDLLAPISEDENQAARDFAANIAVADLGDRNVPEGQWENNLNLLVGAEFGIAEEDFETLIKLNEAWIPFYNAFSTYYSNFHIWEEAFKNDENTEIQEPEYPEEQISVYADFARKIRVFNYIQTTHQGVNLDDNLFIQIDSNSSISPLNNMWKLIYANYTTDRLLSGEFNLDLLSNLMKNENEGDWEKLEDLLAIDGNTIERLRDDSFGIVDSSYTSIQGWIKFVKAYELYAKTHCVLSDLEQLLYEDNAGFNAYVLCFEQTIKNNTKESEWLKFAQEMNDDLRKRKRDALAAYVCWDSCFVPTNDSEPNSEYVSRYPQQFVDESDIYAYYLMDVKMEPDMTISRIVQATASIQLFVQRAELGLEGQNVLTDEQRSEWEWMKNYRVWEAARKVFLYPENWIASDLRDDKTPFFEELEDRIQEFSDDHVSLENALYEYLEKVREVSSIEIIGATKEDGGNEGGILYTLHIVGRTQGEPHTYYYRKYKAKAILSGEWTPWERLDVDIPSETVVPAIVNQRLYLLWPQVTMGQRNLEAASEGGLETIEYYARIQICWTSYTGTKWTGTRMTSNALIDASTNQLDFALGDNEKIDDRYNLKTVSSQDSVAVSVIKTAYHYQEYEEIIGSTEVMDGSTKANKVTKRVYDKSRQFFKRIAIITVKADGSDLLELFTADYQPIDDFAPERTKLVHGVFTEVDEFTCGNKGFNYPEDNAVLNYTPGLFRIVATNLSMLKLGEDDKAEDLPFFYMDGRRTFFVQAVPKDGKANSNQKNYRFELLSHSLVDDFYKRYRDGGTKWLYTRETQALPISDSYYYSYSYYNYYFSVYLGYYMAGDWQAWDLSQTIFRYNYWPNKANVDGPYPAPMVDFVWGGANAMYNWELFFYVPMLIAEKMIAEQSYEEALLWLQLVFDPRERYSSYERTKDFIHDLPKGARYWKFLPFFANKDADKSVLEMLGLPTKQDKLPDRSALSSLVDKWKNDPFNPHLIARYRNVAYQKYVVMKYLDTLIGWGDQEFSKDTTESVNLAIQFYLLAAELLGPKSPEAPEPEALSPLTVRQLLSRTDDLGNAFIEYENSALVGKDKAKVLSIRAMDERAKRTGNIIESMFYFSVPRNDTLFSYWDTIADRLYKIRNSLNIQGVKRTLALFAPPIDPGMLVKARAMGISLDAILNSTSEKLPIYRFNVIVKLAVDMAKDACQMGRDLLAILEKQDAEQLQVFKAKCDKAVVAESKTVHEMEVKSLEAEKVRLEEKKTAKQNTSKKQKAMHLVSTAEKKYQKLMEKVAKIQETVEKVRNIASATFKIPDFKYGSVVNAFGGPRFDIESLGGTKLAENLVSAAESYAARFAQRQLDAAKTKLQAELERRKKEWLLEDEVADAEVVEVEKQEIVNEIKTQQVEKKHKSIENEILRSEQVYEVLSEKFTNNDLYIWLEKELGKVFKQYVKLLLDVAKMAERVYHFEIDGKITPVCDFIKNDYWDNFRKGLLAPERILLDLRRMEKAYLENDVHEMEITRPISLKELQKKADDYQIIDNLYVNPLNKIREDGFCNFQLTEEFFENEFSNLSFLRIKDIRVYVQLDAATSLPYLNAKLTLTEASMYKKIDAALKTSNTSMVASLVHEKTNEVFSSYNSDKMGIFEGCGTVSKWALELNGLTRENDEDDYPIDDVIVYLTYTAREGGGNA
ncbi:neuraminidase-like domain-containing protein [Fibrobacter sp. UWB10]|uniref:Tc toxin subunit A-related protein n=1 Tax=Fibrobacter sp. UWB10 TaxID=1896201 RepID=UPI002403796D|nr:neuraminidase-like domain-containing protein [Fibrobacter sp. UWB10]SMP58180.1 hypothetical protein SAMN05720465_2827 [Fibrobacter sp. UWB10]